MKKINLLVLAMALAWLAGACTPSAQTEPTAAAPQPTQPADLTTPVIVLRRSGGFAGLDEQWQIFSDGRVLSRTGRATETAFQVPAQAVSELLVWLEGSGFFTADVPTPNPDEACCDRYLYELTVTSNGRSHSVVALDTPENLPGDLPEAFRRLEALLGVDI
jgi:hypothetical protein